MEEETKELKQFEGYIKEIDAVVSIFQSAEHTTADSTAFTFTYFSHVGKYYLAKAVILYEVDKVERDLLSGAFKQAIIQAYITLEEEHYNHELLNSNKDRHEFIN